MDVKTLVLLRVLKNNSLKNKGLIDVESQNIHAVIINEIKIYYKPFMLVVCKH